MVIVVGIVRHLVVQTVPRHLIEAEAIFLPRRMIVEIVTMSDETVTDLGAPMTVSVSVIVISGTNAIGVMRIGRMAPMAMRGKVRNLRTDNFCIELSQL